MEESFELSNYLPIRFKNRNEQEYIKFLWDSFESNYKNEKYQFSFIAYHMLFMSFVYFNVWQIKKICAADYDKITLGFNDCFSNASSPFTFSQEQERRIFTLFKFFGLGNEKIGQYKKIVDLRNEVAHSNGNIYFKVQDTVDNKIAEILRFSEEIQQHSKSAIQDCFEKFLIESQNEEERRYIDIQEQINEELVHEHYLSQKDLEFCLEYDITKLSEQPNYAEIEKIFEELKNEYAYYTPSVTVPKKVSTKKKATAKKKTVKKKAVARKKPAAKKKPGAKKKSATRKKAAAKRKRKNK